MATFPLLTSCCLAPWCVCAWLQYYLEAFRHFVAGRMRVSGGTPQEHVMAIVLKFDKEVRACVFLLCFLLPFCVRMDVEATRGRTHRPVPCPPPHTLTSPLSFHTRDR